jgi:transcription elongation factor Elf1|tara:strand:+ start:657 stop:1580 length:924 start_codon:yes stop_codon:yes gene_type:complete
MDYTFLLGSIENILGKSNKRARDNYAFHCPFCNHRKPKLEINMHTTEEGKNFWECWVCQTRGQSIRSLLKQLNTPKDKASEILKYLPKGSYKEYTGLSIVEIPKEFQPLYLASSESYVANMVKKYLYERGLNDNDFIKYGVGYATTGAYGGRVIIPSYSESNQLNFFVARTYDGNYFKYKNPETSKDIIFFENLINWNQPIILCEGVFDAMSIRRNAVPILGKSISTSLYKKIITSKVKDIYVALDTDARDRALEIGEKFLNQGKRVFLVDLPDKDPSEMGFRAFTEHIQTAEELDLPGIMMHKLNL